MTATPLNIIVVGSVDAFLSFSLPFSLLCASLFLFFSFISDVLFVAFIARANPVLLRELYISTLSLIICSESAHPTGRSFLFHRLIGPSAILRYGESEPKKEKQQPYSTVKCVKGELTRAAPPPYPYDIVISSSSQVRLSSPPLEFIHPF
eukprot:gene7441-5239_t